MISNIDINKIVVSNKFPFGKPDFKYFIDFKANSLCIFFPEMSIYKRYSDKTKCMYFIVKDKKNFDKYVTIWENVCHIIKKINIELIYNKKYLKAEKTFNTSFHCFYIPVILFDSVSRKDGNYYPKVFLEKLIHNLFWRNPKYFGFWALAVPAKI